MSVIEFNECLGKGRIVYERLAFLQQRILEANGDDLSLIVSSKGRYGQTFIFILATLQFLALKKNKNLKLEVAHKILEHFEYLDVINHYRSEDKRGLKFRVLEPEKDKPTALILVKEIVDEIPVKMSEWLREDIVSRVGEIFNNAIEHSGASHVIGQRYSKRGRKYCFVCYDTGVGMSEKVRLFNQETYCLTDEGAVKWALTPGRTTADISAGPRGQGLSLLQEFARINKGTIRICTGKALYICSGNGEKISERYAKLGAHFHGTLFEMDINAVDSYYKYKGE